MLNPTQSVCAAGLLGVLLAIPPQGASMEATTNRTAATAGSSATVTSADLAAMMSRMQNMHQRMAAAKTLTEKQSLMLAHFKLMEEEVTVLQQLRLRSSKDFTTEQMLQQRMDMMTMLIRMMIDREPPAGPGTTCLDSQYTTPRK